MKIKLVLILILLLAITLRLINLGNIPMALNWDEASLGYNAYSITQTLKDEHGEFLPVARFMAFGDYKPPGYIYATALVVKFLGLSEFTSRLPSALAGMFLVLFVYLLTKELFGKDKTALLAAFLITVSPWALQFSRGAYEANLATMVTVGGIWFFLRGLRLSSVKNFLVSAICLVIAMYTFNSHRIFVPLIGASLVLIYFKPLLVQWRKALLFGAISLVLVVPMLPHLLSSEGKLRFQEVTWLNDLAPIELANKRMVIDGNDVLSKLIHNRRLVYSLEFLKHYTDHFRGDFLFYSGDVNPRLSIQDIGEMYWLDLPFLLVGLYMVYKKKNRSTIFLFTWLLLAPIPAALARETPHALRALVLMPPLLIFTAIGLSEFKFKKLSVLLALLYTLFIFVYLHDNYWHYPKASAVEWQYGYKQMVSYVSTVEKNYDTIIVTQDYGRPYIYFLFYKQYPPEKYWNNRNASRDYFGFWYVHSFDKYYFDAPTKISGKTLYVMPENSIYVPKKMLKQIKDPNGNIIFNIFE